MAKREFSHPNEMHKYVGQEIGVSDWVDVSQERINQFAEATGDHQWIHVDVERAKKDMPGGKTIAHGFLTLSLIPMLNHQISHINNVRNGINYGIVGHIEALGHLQGLDDFGGRSRNILVRH